MFFANLATPTKPSTRPISITAATAVTPTAFHNLLYGIFSVITATAIIAAIIIMTEPSAIAIAPAFSNQIRQL